MSESRSKSLRVTVEAVSSGCTLLQLSHPALTPMPEELRPASQRAKSAAAVSVGVVAVRRGQSKRGYDTGAPWVSRAKARGDFMEEQHRLEAVRDLVAAGWTLLEAVADGTLWGWRLRLDLSNVCGEALANWDRKPGRTQAERLAVVERALGEMAEQAPRGGWTVTDGGVE